MAPVPQATHDEVFAYKKNPGLHVEITPPGQETALGAHPTQAPAALL